MNDYINKIKAAFLKNKKTSLILILCVAGIFLICFPSTEKTEKSAEESEASDSSYCRLLEEKIKNIVTAVTGDKSCIVAVTLETGSEYIYADQSKTDTDLSKNTDSGDVLTKESEKTEQEYIIIKNKDGSEQALLVTEKKPTVRGVAIVSSGINENTEAGILNAVTSVLGIASRKISITNKP